MVLGVWQVDIERWCIYKNSMRLHAAQNIVHQFLCLGEILGAEEPRDTRTGLFRLGVGGLCRRMQAA